LGLHEGQELFFSGIAYDAPTGVDGSGQLPTDSCLLVTGIADPAPLVAHVRGLFKQVEHVSFPDHHAFSPADLARLAERYAKFAPGPKMLVTTEKDATRLGSVLAGSPLDGTPLATIAMRAVILNEPERFADHLKSLTDGFTPETGIILGTGLSGLGNEIEVRYTVSYSAIPEFPVSTVQGHPGRLLFGLLGGKPVVAMQGRFHYYEGWSMGEVVLPVRVMKYLGIQRLFVSNASGGVNPAMEVGDLMILGDHINLFPNPLIGPNLDALGTRFPEMSEPYDHSLIARAKAIAAANGIKVLTGTYVGLTGPTLETPAEYRYVRNIGGDAVGMSTVPEVIAARHMGLPCFAISVVTDLGVPGRIEKTTHEIVQRVAEKAEPSLTLIMRELIASC
jgi:purine-nucleoside phosphorylase